MYFVITGSRSRSRAYLEFVLIVSLKSEFPLYFPLCQRGM
jgi:hypothetical protein